MAQRRFYSWVICVLRLALVRFIHELSDGVLLGIFDEIRVEFIVAAILGLFDSVNEAKMLDFLLVLLRVKKMECLCSAYALNFVLNQQLEITMDFVGFLSEAEWLKY